MRNLVVADDHAVVRQALCEMLSRKGQWQIVGQAADGAELLTIINKGTNKPDLILLDIEMPNIDGLTALEQLKAQGFSTPVLVLSADKSPRQVRNAIKAGAKGYLPKDVRIDELEFAISSVLNGMTYLSPSVTSNLIDEEGQTGIENNKLSVLSKREIEILSHLAEGKPNRIIGKLLHISTRTVDTHRSNILKKLDLHTNAELVKLAIQCGLIKI